MKNECHGGGALLFSFPRLPSWGKHFHEPGGIHLNLPSSFTTIIPNSDRNVKFFSNFFMFFSFQSLTGSIFQHQGQYQQPNPNSRHHSPIFPWHILRVGHILLLKDLQSQEELLQCHLPPQTVSLLDLSLIHIWRCRRYSLCRSRWSPYH